MKQLIQFVPEFNPTSRTLDFSRLPGFNFTKLYAVINTTRNVPIYIAGAPSLGATLTGVDILTLNYNTDAHGSNDSLNIYYEAEPGYESNTLTETGGNIEKLTKLLEMLLLETKVTNFLLQGLYSPVYPSTYDYIKQIRDQIALEGNDESQSF